MYIMLYFNTGNTHVIFFQRFFAAFFLNLNLK